VVDAQDGAVFQADPRRALDLREQHIHLAAQPADFEVPAVKRAVLDLAAVVIGHELAAAETPANLHAFARERVAKLAPAGDDKVGRAPKQRRGKLAGRLARAFDDRLIIAGEKAVAVAELGDAQRAEIVLEEFARAVLFERNGGNRTHADGTQRVRE